MRFSLRFLLFFVPCILVVAYYVIWHVQGYLDSKNSPHTFIHAWNGTQYDIEYLSEHLAEYKLTPNELSVADLNLWLGEKLSASSPAAIQLKKYDHPTTKLDSWDQTLIAVSLDDNNHPTQDPAKAKLIGLYSKGRDGVSHSNGCDPDDLASWRMESGLNYYETLEQQRYWRNRKNSASIVLLTGTLLLLLLWIIGVIGYRKMFKKE